MAKALVQEAHWLRLLEPSPTVLVTSMFKSQPNVMTAAWLTAIGFDPPLIGLSIHPERLTHELVSKSEMFGISIPTLDLLKAVHRCGIETGRDGDKFERCGLTPTDPEEIEAPRIDECVAHIECGVVQRMTLSDHDLFVGHILLAEAEASLFSDRWFALQDSPLIHHVAAEYYSGSSRAYAVTLDDDDEEQ